MQLEKKPVTTNGDESKSKTHWDVKQEGRDHDSKIFFYIRVEGGTVV